MDRTLLEKILASPRLPSLPRIAMEVVDLCRNDDSTLNDLAQLISQDPALAVKLLQTVNTSGFGLGRSVSTVEEATKMLGLRPIQTLALAFCLANAMTDQCGDAFDMEAFWRRCVFSASAAQELAKFTKTCDPQEAFIAGLLQDIGVLAMATTLGGPYLQIAKVAASNHASLDPLERKNLNLSHPVVGAMLAEKWKLGPMLVSAIHHHHNPDAAPKEFQDICRCVSAGSIAADVLLPDQVAVSATARWFDTLKTTYQLDHAQANIALTAADAHGRAIAGQFNLSPTPKRDIAQILTDANQRLVELALASDHNTRQLQAEKAQLERRATHDTLTALPNRRKFDAFLDEQLAADAPFALILIDLDKFKNINDTFGHNAGDRVLKSQGQLLRDLVPEHALAARYGGEEFAVILPDADIIGGAKLAEKIRLARADAPVDLNPGADATTDPPPRITLSAGVVARSAGNPLAAAELIDRADRALYAAKHAGRNLIRILRLNPAAKSA